MKSKPASAAVTTPAQSRPKSTAPQDSALDTLGATAFVLLAVALCARSLLGEVWGAFMADLLDTAGVKVCGSLTARYTVYLLTAGGVGLATLWIAFTRRPWRISGLEAGALLLIAAAILAIPFASDKRTAINTAADTILPLVAAACLYQLLAHRSHWRRAMLAALVAMAAANCWKATSQKHLEYNQVLRDYQQNRRTVSSPAGWNPTSPANAPREAEGRARQPVGYFQHPNVLAAFLALGLAGTIVALVSSGWRPLRRSPVEHLPLPSQAPPNLAMTAAALLVLLAIWLLVAMLWVGNPGTSTKWIIGSAGATVGLLSTLASALLAWHLRARPKHLAAILASGLVLLQSTLIALAINAPHLYAQLAAHGGKIKSLAVRLNYWEGALKMFAWHPFTGVGPGQFPQSYLAIKPVYAAEGVMNPHNWLLTIAAEWGIIGVIGLLVALCTSFWMILRTLSRPAQDDHRPAGAALLPATLVLLGCWWIAISDISPAGRTVALAIPVAVSFIAMASVSLSGLYGRLGQMILLASLVGFVIDSTVETASGTPGAIWPFWAAVVLTMAWKGEDADALPVQSLRQRRLRRAGLILSGATALAVMALTIQPMYAFSLMERARVALAAQQRDRAVELLRTAGRVDTLDPLPVHIAAYLQRQSIPYALSRELYYLQQAIELYEETVNRDRLSYARWRSLAIVRMHLACRLEDPKGVDRAIATMRKAVDLFPNAAEGWIELAQMAAVTSDRLPDRPALLRMAIDANDKALTLDAQWDPDDKAARLTPQKRAELLWAQQQLEQRLQAVLAASPATQPAP